MYYSKYYCIDKGKPVETQGRKAIGAKIVENDNCQPAAEMKIMVLYRPMLLHRFIFFKKIQTKLQGEKEVNYFAVHKLCRS